MELLEKKQRIFSVTQITQDIKIVLEANFQGLWVEGEISNLRIPSSGHAYFTLKDENAQISAVLFKNAGMSVKFKLQDGQKILVFADVDVYEKQGKYQLIIKKIEPKGVGALQLAFEELKKRLYAEGLFDESRKKKIPLFPQKIGIVTSPTGAAIKDILNIIERRFSNLNIIINPVRVQGDDAAVEIANAVDEFNKMGEVDVIIVTRGGGSLEDLRAFNEEAVARAIYRSQIPVISAVGHEIDYTISDFAADLRCPTPSAAAELVIGEKEDIIESINNMIRALNYIVENSIQNYNNRLKLAAENRFFKDPASIIRDYQQDVDSYTDLLKTGIIRVVDFKKMGAKAVIEKLETLSPLAVLGRGYSLTTLKEKVLRSAGVLKAGDIVKTRLDKGSFESKVTEMSNE